MSLYCNIFGHDWIYSNEVVESEQTNFLGKFKVKISKEFRRCDKCNYKQERHHHTGISNTDWVDSKLNKEEYRDKKLKELGIK